MIWRKMSTAPKGRCLFLVMADDTVTVGWWADEEGEYQEPSDPHNYQRKGAWIDGTVADWGMQEYRLLDPVGWLPRDALPSVGRRARVT